MTHIMFIEPSAFLFSPGLNFYIFTCYFIKLRKICSSGRLDRLLLIQLTYWLLVLQSCVCVVVYTYISTSFDIHIVLREGMSPFALSFSSLAFALFQALFPCLIRLEDFERQEHQWKEQGQSEPEAAFWKPRGVVRSALYSRAARCTSTYAFWLGLVANGTLSQHHDCMAGGNSQMGIDGPEIHLRAKRNNLKCIKGTDCSVLSTSHTHG